MSEFSLERIIDGYQTTALVYAAIRLDIPDMLNAGDGLSSVLAERTGWSPEALYRFLRALASIGICDEIPPDTFRLNKLGQELTSHSASGMREKAIMAVEQYWPAWRNLEYSVRSGEQAFERVFGESPWKYRKTHSESGQVFDTWLAKETSHVAGGIARKVDFSSAGIIADIGGGSGGLLRKLLELHPHLDGILFDQPHVIARLAQEADTPSNLERITLLGGDFFSRIEIKADIYLLKSVLHDWNDRDAAVIIRNCRSCMSPDARLVIIERIIPDRALGDVSTTLIDLQMMLVTGGHERKMTEFEKLLGQEGFSISCVSKPTNHHFAIEALPS